MGNDEKEDILPPGQNVGFMTLDRFAAIHGTKPRRHNGSPLIYLLICIRQGSGFCYIDNERMELNAGAFILVNPFSFLCLAQVQYVFGSVILFTETFFIQSHYHETLLYKATYQPKRRLAFHLEGRRALWDAIILNFKTFGMEYNTQKDSEMKARFLRIVLNICLLLVHKLQLEQEGAAYDVEEPLAKNKVVEFIRLLNIHFKDEHTTDFYAAKMFLSTKAFIELCKRGIGWTPKEMMQSKLLTESRRLLIFDPRPVTEISMSLGFKEYRLFHKFFTLYTGVSPKAYRLKNSIRTAG